MSAVSTIVCAVTMASRVSNRDCVSSFMSVPLAGGGVGTPIVSREWAGAPCLPADHGCESPAAVRPLAFGLAGFFLHAWRRVHGALIVFFYPKTSIQTTTNLL